MGVLGLAHLILQPSDNVLRAFGWVWPIALAVLVVWIFIQVRRSLHKWSRPVIIYPVLVVLLLAAFGGAYETIRETQDEAAYPKSGRSIDVGGRTLHISCTGSGTPTVVLEPGLGEPGAMMAGWIQPGVAETTRVCVYDRAGKGWSEQAEGPRDGLAIAADLHALLSAAGVPGPYVLVGHSSGGVYVQVYAARYPDEVAGMVLLDSQPPDAFASLPGYPGVYEALRKATALFPSLARIGVMRLIYSFSVVDLPPEARAEERAIWSTASHNRSLRDEVAGLKAALTQAQDLTTLGEKPLIVLTAAKGAETGWLPLQDEMAGLSTNSVHRVLQAATHPSLTEDEDVAAMSVRAILDVVEAVEGDSRRRGCVLRGGPCGLDGHCDVHDIFFAAQDAMLRTLSGAALADLPHRSGSRVGADEHRPDE